MPRKLSRTKRLAALTAVAAGALVASPGAALAADCPALPSSKPFVAWADFADYSLAPGGSSRAASRGPRPARPRSCSPTTPST